MSDPRPSAPIMFGIQTENTDLLPWSWAEERLNAARNFWISSTRPDGRPHSRPIWAVWLDNALWYSTGSLARTNLVTNDAYEVHIDDGESVVIVEGRARPVHHEPDAVQRMCEVYSTKYDYPMTPHGDEIRSSDGQGGPVFVLDPEVAFGWIGEIERPTRWRFTSPTS
ncbi:pyridoxamine 5'-phosphate oxidase family protein [Aldersonia kunmingensis]|uniref:pyridoxamine 5'-phosphate oxidase family protein n=1 Tax=Aldersonia kunmingensis TaxID=408066 RepID=UPI00082EF124|nr:pyridoxamine 5'-phosphate oxidase family protein [Aldersonia kunmingensis]